MASTPIARVHPVANGTIVPDARSADELHGTLTGILGVHIRSVVVLEDQVIVVYPDALNKGQQNRMTELVLAFVRRDGRSHLALGATKESKLVGRSPVLQLINRAKVKAGIK